MSGIKNCIENHDIRGVRYIFVDSLDVDPTFEKYCEDYEYCKEHMKGFFEDHEELTFFITEKEKWDFSYWVKLKTDLMKNFSEKRFEHMRQVATVVYRDKIKRIRAERQSAAQIQKDDQDILNFEPNVNHFVPKNPEEESAEERERKRLEERREILRKEEEEKNEKIKRLRQASLDKAMKRVTSSRASDVQIEGRHDSKKIWGIVLALVMAAIVSLAIGQLIH